MRKPVILTLGILFVTVLILSLIFFPRPSTLVETEDFPTKDDLRSISLIKENVDELSIAQLSEQEIEQFFPLLSDAELNRGRYEGGDEYSIRLHTNTGTYRLMLNTNGELLIDGNEYQIEQYNELLKFIDELNDWEELE
ncbi:hypothetical protein [Bacillus sp. Marseille-P3800]|uniref:hypothetical protein n=1 Tax=Bacillus sp. Marseille-P3800 TaxID=2014782 RepID=UPI000C081481|nr:hypothetical protein [Bacillus sp. Marseille-P3800]